MRLFRVTLRSAGAYPRQDEVDPVAPREQEMMHLTQQDWVAAGVLIVLAVIMCLQCWNFDPKRDVPPIEDDDEIDPD